MRHQRGWRAVGNDAPGLQHDDAVGKAQRFQHVVRDHHRGQAQLVVQAPVVLGQAVARQRVERGERLVHENDVRPGRQRARDADALALAARQLVREARAIVGIEAHEAQQLVDARGLARCSSQPSSRGVMAMFSATVMCGNRPTSWNT